MSIYAITHHRTQVDTSGQLIISNGHAYGAFFAPIGLIFFASWIVAVVYQVVSWRRASGERRQQLSWLMAGAPRPSSRSSPRSRPAPCRTASAARSVTSS